ncbi:diacylglycerol/lipid kinase family protein [Haloglomus litoreum]|uniref:diacylglycerol/lipid kinase family protein n=1 Tax=Haloglomus litoreum TaxID=3034026 RepID=UPI0023E8989D|nr:diacylglycerol kinase family protein [Haloglomus sp. DT116]
MHGARRVLVRNPNSGDGRATKHAKRIATDRGYEVRDSEGGDHTVELAEDAVRDGADLLAACGGDGTLNKVVRGALTAGGGETVPDGLTLGVVPAGTGNDFADNVGVRSVEHAFSVLNRNDPAGETRELDLGLAGDRPFVNSCVGGLTADASARTTRESKRRLGVLAYVLSTLREYQDFEPMSVTLRGGEDDDAPTWSGDALVVLVGNGRRFPGERMRQANMEDGLLNVVVIERAPAIDYVASGAANRLLKREASYLTRLRVPQLSVECHRPVGFSLDGEMVEHDHLRARSLPGAMPFRVGEGYDPAPEEWSRRLR